MIANDLWAENLLKRFIRLYANSDHHSSDIREIMLFQLWMDACRVLDVGQLEEDNLRRTMARTIKDDGR